MKRNILSTMLLFLFLSFKNNTLALTAEDIKKELKNYSLAAINQALAEISKREEKFSKDASWMYYPEIVNLIKKLKSSSGLGLQGAEIGVLYGGNVAWLLDHTAPELIHKVFCIDPYDKAFFDDAALADVLYVKTRHVLKKFKKRAELIRLKSAQALNRFAHSSLDFVFIDGDHTYQAVRTDLGWFDKVKPGGLVIGDDFHASFPGVQRAVKEFCKKKGLKLNQAGHEGRIWWVRKPTVEQKQAFYSDCGCNA